MRVGLGYDVHALVEGRALILGGVRIPFDKGLLGHSDADALCHAVADAILGAAALGDIGEHFPDTDPAYKDADSLRLLAAAADEVRAAGWEIVNVDSVIVVQAPRLSPFKERMAANLARALGLRADAVSVKAKTHEGFDATGRGEAVAVQAVALLDRPGRA